MDSVFLAIFSEEEEKMPLKRYTQNLRNKFDPMDLADNLFVKSFRLNKRAFQYVLNEIQDEMPFVLKCGLTPKQKLAACLRFFAEGNFQHGSGQGFDVAIAQSTFSRILSEMVPLLERKLCSKWISLCMTEEEKREAKLTFYENTGFPGTIMCLDGTHVSIIAPKENKNLFYNRKGFYSINTLIICDHQQYIRFVDSRHQGASHDSHIWRLSDARKLFEQSNRNGERGTWILGDAAFPLEPWLMTPIRSPEGRAESIYNTKHTKARNIVERTIGLLKNRFLCVNNARRLHYSPKKASQIINVCCALHNICLKFKIQDEIQIIDNQDDNLNVDFLEGTSSNTSEAVAVRNSIVNSMQ